MTPKDANDRIGPFFTSGILMMVVGVVVLLVGWPEAAPADCEPGFDLTECEDSGSVVAQIAGLFVAGVGQILVLIGVIGLGVKYGSMAAHAAQAAESTADAAVSPSDQGPADAAQGEPHGE